VSRILAQLDRYRTSHAARSRRSGPSSMVSSASSPDRVHRLSRGAGGPRARALGRRRQALRAADADRAQPVTPIARRWPARGSNLGDAARRTSTASRRPGSSSAFAIRMRSSPSPTRRIAPGRASPSTCSARISGSRRGLHVRDPGQAVRAQGPAGQLIAEIVHEADLHDGKFTRNESTGVDLAIRALAEAPRMIRSSSIAACIFDGLHSS